jgi:putative endopeptidase
MLATSSAVAAAEGPRSPLPTPAAPAVAATLKSGIDTQFTDDTIRAQDNFYQHVNGKWLSSVQIPPDRAIWGSYATLRDTVAGQLRDLIQNAADNPAADPSERKIGDLYASFMDTQRLDALGARPLNLDLAKIDAIEDKRKLPAFLAHLNRIGANAPYGTGVTQDAQDPQSYAVVLEQGGLGLPDRDYYLSADPKFTDIRAKYQAHVETMLSLIDDRNAQSDAKSILSLETVIARAQWTKVANRDPVATYNKIALANLGVLIPGYDWRAYILEAGLKGRVDSLIVAQPSYVQALGHILTTTPLPVWKAYFKWVLVNNAAPYLAKPFVDAHFAFYGATLKGVPENLPRWKRGVVLVDDAIGEALGQLYVAQYFPKAYKVRVEALVGNLLAAYRARIDTLDWMDDATRAHAQAKLAKIMVKIGYPDKWRDYSTLSISRDDLMGNIERSNEFDYQRDLNRLGGPVDHAEWQMTPQTVNAYYDPQMNEIVFPAAYLQPNDFQPDADDAANYGAIGATIGHEISHGFDDQGSQYDADGKLRNWWTPATRAKYSAKTEALAVEYNAFEPLPGFHLNGHLTLGENIADNSGLAIAYLAYHAALDSREPPIIDGLTGDQRFFLSFAQSWRIKVRPEQALVGLKSDPHSPAEFRVLGTVVNQPAFYSAFDIHAGDKMYRAPDNRVTIW